MEYTKHHIVPKSRKRKSKAKVLLPADFHEAWHRVFGNLKPDEALAFVADMNKAMRKQRVVTMSQIQRLREKNKEV